MREDVYKRHIDNYKKHWWFQARKNIIEKSIKKFINYLNFLFGISIIGIFQKR